MAKRLKAILLSMAMLLTMFTPFAMVSAEETVPAGLDKILVIANMNHKIDGEKTYYPIHIYAGIDSLSYREVGFDLHVVNTNADTTMSKSTKVVYTSMNVMSSNGNVTEYTATQLGGNYMFGQELLFSAKSWFNADTVIEVTPYALNLDGSKTTGKTITVSDEVIKKSNPDSCLFREIKTEPGDDPAEGDVIASGTTDVTPTEDGKVSGDGITINADTISAEVPGGVALEDGATELTLSLTALEKSESNVETGENEELAAYDVNIAGVAKENDVPILVTINDVVQNGLNKGNISVYHVEADGTKEMERVDSVDELTGHNQFAYEPADGTLTLALASFSEVAVVADTENAWNGYVLDSTKDTLKGEGTKDNPYIIANADQLALFSDLVSNGFDTTGK